MIWRLVFTGLVLLMVLTPIAAVAAEDSHGAEEGQQNNIFIGDFWEAIWTLVAFVLLLVVLWRFAWKPLLGALQAREEHIQRQIDEAEQVRKDAEGVLSEYRSKLSEAEQQGKNIVDQHVKQAEKEAHEVMVKAEQDMEAMRIRLETELEKSRRLAQKELLEQSGQIIFNLGREILGRSIETEDNQRLITDAIDRLEHEQNQQLLDARLPDEEAEEGQ
ncbi:MAG: F0F1 ATP synthase subunit B [Sedimentisphaerales bacterium]|nr:F0F1 ATP synthase subunit B [Sedimentisphaerales bacterium]